MLSFFHQVFESDANKPGIVLQILESGYLLVLQGQESLVSWLCGYGCEEFLLIFFLWYRPRPW